MTDPNQREIVVAILDEVLEQGKYSHLVLKATLDKYQYLSKQQRAFITRLTQGTIERLLQIDAILNQFVKKPFFISPFYIFYFLLYLSSFFLSHCR